MDLQKVREALITAIEAMSERRGYSEAFEYKYKEQWDEEDKIVREALVELERSEVHDEENDAYDVALDLLSISNKESTPRRYAGIIQQYAEAYHSCKLAEGTSAILAASDRLGAALDEADKMR